MTQRSYLDAQVERLADEAEGNLVDVLVEMHVQDDELDRLLGTATEAIQRRSLALSATDILPVPASMLSKGEGVKLTKSEKDAFSQATFSLASQIALSSLLPGASGLVSVAASAVLSTFLSSDLMKDVVAKQAARHRTEYPTVEAAVPSFSSSATAAMRVSKEHLRRLPEMPEVANITLNRTHRISPVARVQKVPEIVAQNKSCSWGIQKTSALAAWGAYGQKGSGVKVAILDTGVDATHPELKDRVEAFAEFDSFGRIVATSTTPYDSDQHGTHCCGIVAGSNAGGPWIGMAPDAKLLVGMVLKGGSGTDAQILGGMDWAISNGADVISMSLGGLSMTPDVVDTYTRAILNANRAGIPVVVAIGNDGHQTSGLPGSDYFALAVGATDPYDKAAGFSAGRTQIIQTSRYIDPKYLPLVYRKPDISAPGVAVYSSVPGGKYETWNGTSMATPHVAGALALLLSNTNIRQVDQSKRAYLLQDLLTAGVEELGEAGQNQRFGFGRIDVLRSIGHAKDLGY